MIYFWAQNDPEIGPLMPIFNTNLKVGGGVRRNGGTVCSLTGGWGVGEYGVMVGLCAHSLETTGPQMMLENQAYTNVMPHPDDALLRHDDSCCDVMKEMCRKCCPGDHQEIGRIMVAQRYQILGTAVSERPGHFLISWLGAVGSI